MLYIIRVLYFYYDCGMTIKFIDHTIIINKEHFMKIAFLIPVLEDIDISRTYDIIKESCDGTDFEIIFAINGKLNRLFTNLRNTFIDKSEVRAFMIDRPEDEHKLITIGMSYCNDYDATIIYSAKEEPNIDVIRAFITSWKAGNKIVYLKKEYSGLKNIVVSLKRAVYRTCIKMLGIFNDQCAETDIQLLDQDVVQTINQLPSKNRQLRVLDSFVGYSTDVIQLEIDSKVKENRTYISKPKSASTCNLVASVSLLALIVCIGLFVANNSLHWNLPILAIVGILVLAVGTAVISWIYYTKSSLLLRIGQLYDMNDLRDIENKLEKYNIKM